VLSAAPSRAASTSSVGQREAIRLQAALVFPGPPLAHNTLTLLTSTTTWCGLRLPSEMTKQSLTSEPVLIARAILRQVPNLAPLRAPTRLRAAAASFEIVSLMQFRRLLRCPKLAPACPSAGGRAARSNFSRARPLRLRRVFVDGSVLCCQVTQYAYFGQSVHGRALCRSRRQHREG
jgi:hypothetical protein